eukprot:TRINITY_DN94466_c0_g1_i1.p2 TRINITY_DN94466_c0_g1~~TRINITY_DN94466_c0_g1_i1.p2  ORF type:complete len:128 (-),score=25.00 TRINITY_DN94466_c0_g1_i1:150-506(-)
MSGQCLEMKVKIQAPSSGYKIKIEKIYQAGQTVIALCRVSQSEGMAAQAITGIEDSFLCPAAVFHGGVSTEVQYYVIGRSWTSPENNEADVTFVESDDAFQAKVKEAGGRMVFNAPKK